MIKNSSGKVLTVFALIFAILLISLTAISLFLFQKEVEKKEMAEINLRRAKATATKLENDMTVVKKENFLLAEKNKELDDKLNDMTDELELEKGLREQMKTENIGLKEKLDTEIKTRNELKKQLSDNLSSFESKMSELTGQLSDARNVRQQLEGKVNELENHVVELKQGFDSSLVDVSSDSPSSLSGQGAGSLKDEVELDKIVVLPEDIPEGRILSVDSDTEFVIVNLGEKDGVQRGAIMSVFRGSDYLGDIRITRVQPEMAAADFVPPFSSLKARKNDQVVTKK